MIQRSHTIENDETSIEPIAVVGLSLRLPGGANDAEGLWELLASGKPAWTPVPADRYNEKAFFHPNADDPNGTNNHPGGHFISGDVRDFDHSFFNFTKSQAAAIDPQQRILMELAYEALENAGIPREHVQGTATSVFAALFPTDYNGHLFRDMLDVPTYYITGVEKAILSNRLSHVLDLRGPSMTIDTACSGGLVALHQACQSLRGRESDTAIVAASNLILGPDQFIGLSNLHMLSSTGRCYPFDERGKGYGRGEGVAVLILKRLSDALRDRDPIRAVVRSSAIGQDGYTPQSITYPNGQAQAQLARATYARAGLRPEDIVYIEAHGTGTKAGDKEELEGINEVFAGDGDRSMPLYVGSIKGAIGHTEAVAGLASLLKATLMLEHEQIPPVAGFAKPKPGLPMGCVQIPTELIPWPHTAGITPQISINSFGFGGANAHAILEQAPKIPRKQQRLEAASPRLFTISANSTMSLKAMITAYHNWVDQRVETPLADLSYTLLYRRSALKYRFSTVAEDRNSLLRSLKEGFAAATTKPASSEVDVVMVFTGQGAQWAGMGRELLLEHTTSSTIFRESIFKSRDILQKLGATWDLLTELLREGPETRLGEAELAQPCTTATQIALVTLLQAQGVRPHAVVGHSSGEIAAAYTAGHLSQTAAMKVAFYRGAMANAVKTKNIGPGAMLSVGLGEQDAAQYIQDLPKGKAVIACINSPRSVTISGDADAVDEVDARIAAANDGTFHRKLQVDRAYHSHHMRAVSDDYLAHIKDLEVEDVAAVHSNPVSFTSSVTGQLKTTGFGGEYWVSNFISPVRFSEAVQTIGKTRHQPGKQILFIEIGPHPALSGPVRQCLQHDNMPKIPFDYHSPMQRGVNTVASTLNLAGKLFERGVQLDWDAVSALAIGADTAITRHDLPLYTWDHSVKHWYESRVARAYRLRKEPYHDLLGVPALEATEIEPRWRHFLGQANIPWLADHIVDGLTVFPGAGYVCMAVEGISQLARQRFPKYLLETITLRDIAFKRGLVIPDSSRVELQLSFKPQKDSAMCFRFTIVALSDSGEWYEHASGIVEGVLSEEGPAKETIKQPLPLLPLDSDITSKEDLYKGMSNIGNTYGPTFAGLHSIQMAADASQALASFNVFDLKACMPGKHQQPHIIQPSTLDIIFHTALPLVSRRLGPGSVMPVHVDEILISTNASLHVPDSELDVSAELTYSHFRTAVSDLSVLFSGERVLTISGMEFRSLGSSAGGVKTSTTGIRGNGEVENDQPSEICYELEMQLDKQYLRSDDMPQLSTLTDLTSQIALSRYGWSTVGLGLSVDVSEEILGTIGANNKVLSHDFVDATPGRFEVAAKRLKGHKTQFRILRPGTDPVARGFEPTSYDLVVVAAPKWLNQAAKLVKPDGTLLIVLSARESKDETWRTALQKTSTEIMEQLSFRESPQGRLIAMAKPVGLRLPENVNILTHSKDSVSTWVSAIKTGLQERNVRVSVSPLNSNTIKSLHTNGVREENNSNVTIIVDDVLSSPILTDKHTFGAAVSLLGQPEKLVWISPDDLLPFHQIEGVARTAHAENDDLRLSTIHISSSLLNSGGVYNRLVDLVANVVSQVANSDTPHIEREYRMRKDGGIVIPRLKFSDRLNQAVSNTDLGPETTIQPFNDIKQPLQLSTDGSTLFTANIQSSDVPLDEDEIEVETDAFVLNKGDLTRQLGESVGHVKKVGARVQNLKIGDRVVALSSSIGANLLRIPHNHAAQISAAASPEAAVGLLLNAMSASYALRGLARLLSSDGTVLIHGIRTAAGRAVTAVAQSIGVRITATAADLAEARLIEQQTGIASANIFVDRRSIYHQSAKKFFNGRLDAIIQAGEGSISAEILSQVKPFGSVITLDISSTSTAEVLKLPSNVAFYSVDIIGLVKARPDLSSALISEAAIVLEHIPLSGLEIPTRDVSDVAEALRLLNTGVHRTMVLQASSTSSVNVISNPKENVWAREDATYLVAGGLGDIGKRFLGLMAQRGAKHLATISRRTLDSDAYHALQAKLEAWSPGLRLYVLQADVTSESSIQSAAEALRSQGAPPVRGIIQATTLMNDRPLELTTYEDYKSVTDIKVNGTLALHRTFASPDLSFYLSLSSVSNIVGAQAEASYNAGNAVQDALAHQEKQDLGATRFFTINFGWIEDAVLTADDDVRQGALRRAGFSLTRSQQLLRFFDYILGAVVDPATSFDQAIIGFDADSLAGATAYNGTIQSGLFSQVRHARRADSDGENTDHDSSTGSGRSFEEVVSEGDSEAVTDFISTAMTQQLARLISVDISSIDARSGSILALGLDSLVAVELRNWVMRQFDAPLQSSEILANQTVYTLAEKVTTRSKKIVAAAA